MSTEQLYGRKLIFQGQDAAGPVEVVEDDKVRSLHFGSGSPQSEMSLTDPYALTLDYFRLMMMSLLFQEKVDNVLLLGLGGGSMAKFLWKYFPQCHLDLVENRPLVVDLAYKYFELPKDPRLSVHVMDALEFLKQGEKKYDLIFVDLFAEVGMDKIVGEIGFFKQCRRLLDQNGILVWNTWSLTPPELMVKCIEQLKLHFYNDISIFHDQKGNNVFLIFSRRIVRDNFRLMQRAKELHQKTGLDFPQMLIDSYG